MLFSVVIVNYRVKPFLEQCLLSLRWAKGDVAVEAIVIDNGPENDQPWFSENFPECRYEWAGSNLGFGKASNRGAAMAKGEWLLFLNPDTLLPPGFFPALYAYAQAHDKAGALGPKLKDDRGRFLPESKRGMPYPFAVFFRYSQLWRLFPRNSVINHYYQGQLDENRSWVVDVLSGACLAVRRQAWEAVQGFDEAFFMYGEDIDLSWRIKQAGWENHYLHQPQALHFKGESAAQDAVSHRHFYQAMVIFSEKHFGKRGWMGQRMLAVMAKLGAGWRGRRRASAGSTSGNRWWLTGDAQAVETLKALIPNNITLATTAVEADREIVCLGSGDALNRFLGEYTRRNRPCGFYTMGAGWVIGSDERGDGHSLFRLK